MPGVICLRGREEMAKAWAGLGFNADAYYQIKLLKNNFTLDVTPGPGSLTEAAFGGYAPIDMTLDVSPAPVLDGDEYTVLLGAAPYVWDCTSAPETIYGWCLYSGDWEDFLILHKYDTPHVLEVGSRHTLYPSVRIGACA